MEKFDILALAIIFSFLLITILLPIYDDVNGFHNIIFDDYKLIWYDGKSPENFYLIRNIIKNGPVSFPKGYMIGSIPVENLFDFREKNGLFYPTYPIFTNYIFAAILSFIPFVSDIQLFKAIIILNMIFFSIILVFFYYIQKSLNLKSKYAFISTLIAGVATTPIIYSRYLFISDMMLALLFIIITYKLIKIFEKRIFRKIDLIFVVFILTAITILYFSVFQIFIPSIIVLYLLYLLVKDNKIKLKLKSATTLISIFIIIFIVLYLNLPPPSYFSTLIFPKFIPALDFLIYGFHNPATVWKLDRTFSDFYAFEEQPGNAIFYRFYGLFGSLFGAKGFIYNSPFLIFSIFGIFLLYNNFKIKFLILIPLIGFLSIGLLTYFWYGGVTPRYDRFSTVPALFLTFFSFYYIQEISKEKNKIKSLLVYMLFSFLVILSILNVTSLAVRADWTYEHEADLVSYDLVIWPWYPLKPQGNVINLYLTEQGESLGWRFGGEIENCKSYGNLEGITTPLCGCEFATYAERTLNIPWEKVRINVTACSGNGDGIIGNFYFDKIKRGIFIEPNSCKEESMLIENSNGSHTLVLKPEKYKDCNDEIVVWKLINIEKI